MRDNRFERLTPRQRDCLRLVRELQSTKQIATMLGIRPGTVNGYLDEAVTILGAADRRSAALEFGRHEGPRPERIGGDSIRFEYYGLIDPTHSVGSIGQAAAVNVVQDERVRFEATQEQLASRRLQLPWSEGGNRNELTLTQRAFWGVIIALAIIIAFGSFVAAVEGIARIGRVTYRQ